jgi:flagellar hook-length control protein FliK
VLARQRAGVTATEAGQAASSGEAGARNDGGMAEEACLPAQEAGAAAAAVLPGALVLGISTQAGDAVEQRAGDADGLAAGEGAVAAWLPSMLAQTAPAAGSPQQADGIGARNGARAAAFPPFHGMDASAGAATDGMTGAKPGEAHPMVLGASGAGEFPLLAGAAGESPQSMQPAAVALASLSPGGAVPFTSGVQSAAPMRLEAPLASNPWSGEFSQKITWMITQRELTAELRLNPPDLGPLEVVLSVSGDQAAAQFSSPHAAVRNAVEQALPKLREMLADNGIMLNNATVSDQRPGERQAERGQQPPGGRMAESPASVAGQAGAAIWPGRRHEGMVDTFA